MVDAAGAGPAGPVKGSAGGEAGATANAAVTLQDLPAGVPAEERGALAGRDGTLGGPQGVLEMAPPLLSILVFLAGVALLASAAQPALPDRLDALLAAWPLAAVELSHFLASIIGVLLLFVASGLWRRREGAWAMTIGLLLAGAVFSLVKALDWEEASLLAAIAVAMLPLRAAFFRQSRIMGRGPSLAWLAAVIAVLVAAVWLMMVSHGNAAFREDVWWTIAGDADISRSVRAMIGACVLGLLVFALAAVSPSAREQARDRGGPEALARADAILKAGGGSRGDAWLMHSGDKSFVFAPSGRSFVMYRRWGGLWIAMGGPVGPADDRVEALMAFHAAADTGSASPVVYAATEELLLPLIDMGWSVRKIGETAVVQLPSFSMDGAARSRLRQVVSRLGKRDGWQVQVRAPGETDDWDALERVSSDWLARHTGREKAFSMGRFDRAFLARTPLAVMSRADTGPVAFASLMPSPDGTEVAVDLMRSSSAAPPSSMDFLLLEAIRWAKEAGFASFDIGMTPLAGLNAARYAAPMGRLGARVFALGDGIYGFQGLRDYKAKFGPVWKPVFIAAPGHVSLPLALTATALLTSGGIAGMLWRPARQAA